MRTARRVIVLLLVLTAGGGLPAQQSNPPDQKRDTAAAAGGSVDTDVTVTGRDDSILPLPEPGGFDAELVLPPFDTTPQTTLVPPITPSPSTPPSSPLPDPKGLLSERSPS